MSRRHSLIESGLDWVLMLLIILRDFATWLLRSWESPIPFLAIATFYLSTLYMHCHEPTPSNMS